MLASIKKKWLAALRSGKIKQGHTQLVTRTAGGETAFCCLGVLATIVDPARATGWCNSDGYFADIAPGFDFAPASAEIVRKGQAQLALLGKGGLGAVKAHRLANLNDGYVDKNGKKQPPRSFKYIAAYIDRYV